MFTVCSKEFICILSIVGGG